MVVKRISYFITWLLATLLASILLIVPILCLWSLNWIKSDDGGKFIQSALESQIKASGNELDIKGLKYIYPSSLHIDKLQIYMEGNSMHKFNNINLKINARTVFAGKLFASGFYDKKKITLITNYSLKNNRVSLKNINLSAPDFNAKGDLYINNSSKIITGDIFANLDSLLSYKEFISPEHEIKNIGADISFINDRGAQKINLDIDIPSYENKSFGMVVSGLKINSSILKDGDNYKVSGTISPNNININLPEKFTTSAQQLNIVTSKTKAAKSKKVANNIELNLLINAPDKIFVRGWGLDAEFGGKVRITDHLNDPKFNGEFGFLRGGYSEFGKNFKIARAKLSFTGSVPPSPYLDILAEIEAGDKTAQISINGSALKPEISFSSNPSMPEDEVLSYILFGSGLDTISPFQAIQLVQTLRRFSGQGGSGIDPIGELRSITGLDNLNFETGEDGNSSVGAGKYISDNVYLELETGSGENANSATIEIELTPSITIESEIGQDARSGAAIMWKRDY